MRLELINTGTELLLGRAIKHAPLMARREFVSAEFAHPRQPAIPGGEIIRQALFEATGRADIVIVTRGPGPASDDLTRGFQTSSRVTFPKSPTDHGTHGPSLLITWRR